MLWRVTRVTRWLISIRCDGLETCPGFVFPPSALGELSIPPRHHLILNKYDNAWMDSIYHQVVFAESPKNTDAWVGLLHLVFYNLVPEATPTKAGPHVTIFKRKRKLLTCLDCFPTFHQLCAGMSSSLKNSTKLLQQLFSATSLPNKTCCKPLMNETMCWI